MRKCHQWVLNGWSFDFGSLSKLSLFCQHPMKHRFTYAGLQNIFREMTLLPKSLCFPFNTRISTKTTTVADIAHIGLGANVGRNTIVWSTDYVMRAVVLLKWGLPNCNGRDVSAGEPSSRDEYWCVWLIATSMGSNLKGGQWWMSFLHLLTVWCIMHPHLIREADEARGDEGCPCPTHPDIGYINDCASTPFISQLTGHGRS